MKVSLKKFSKLALVAGASMVCASGAFAQATASTTATTNANIVIPITIAKDVDMSFGNLVAHATTDGYATLGVTNGVTFTAASVTAPGAQVGTRTSAQFTVSGEGTFTYALTLPSTTQTLAHSSDSMDLDTFTSDLVGGIGTLSGSAGSSGTSVFKVGARLAVLHGQAPGVYAGSFSVTVAYN